MAVTSLTSSDWYQMLPSQSTAEGVSSGENTGSTDTSRYPKQDYVTLSAQAQIIDQQKQAQEKLKDSPPDQDFIQISSSIGRSSRISGLSHDDALELYRSIERLS